jgi:hypothetical protein
MKFRLKYVSPWEYFVNPSEKLCNHGERTTGPNRLTECMSGVGIEVKSPEIGNWTEPLDIVEQTNNISRYLYQMVEQVLDA